MYKQNCKQQSISTVRSEDPPHIIFTLKNNLDSKKKTSASFWAKCS